VVAVQAIVILGFLVMLITAACGAGAASPGAATERPTASVPASPTETATESPAGPSGSGPAGSGTAAVCAQIDELRDSVDALESTNPDGSRQELRQAIDRVTAAWANVTDSLATELSSHRQELESSYDELKAAIDGLPNDITPRDALAQLQPAATAFAADVRSALDDMRCD
jgi:hypothetical protein